MELAVIGPSSMGLLYGGKLSAVTDTILVGNNLANLNEINTHGVTILRREEAVTCPVKAVPNGAQREPADVILLFTKAYLTQ
jgi:ketopantoate reductase